MADAPAPTTAPTTPAAAEASDAELFGKFTAQHNAAVAQELGNADASKSVRGPGAAARAADHVESAASNGAARGNPGGADAGADRDGTDGAGSEEGRPDEAGDPEAEAEAPATLSEADAVALLRKARADGDTDGIDRALKALLPDSKGLSEFNVDGSRYAQFRTVVNRATKKLDTRAAEVTTREQNVARGLAQVEQLVSRYQPIEALLHKAQGDDVDAFVELLEKATGKPLNDTLKRHLDKKLGKPVDPELDAVKRELQSEKQARLERERREEEARSTAARTEEIKGHLQFLHQSLSTDADRRVAALVTTREGMKAIFEAQEKHYNPRTGQTLSPQQAAKWVLEQKQKELEPWQRVLTPKALPAAAPAKGEPITETPRVRSLPSRGASPASGGAQRLSDAELFEKYERLAKLSNG
jgi:hypothetical protein